MQPHRQAHRNCRNHHGNSSTEFIMRASKVNYLANKEKKHTQTVSSVHRNAHTIEIISLRFQITAMTETIFFVAK